MSTVEAANSREGRYLTPQQRQAIAASVASGRSQTDVAKDFHVSRVTVGRVMAEVREASTKMTGDWRTTQTAKAIKAVDAGLDASDDPYKRATIGVSVLKGLGVYSDGGSTNVTTNLFVNVQDLPQDWYSRMRPIEESDAPAQDVVVRDITPSPNTDDKPTT